MIFYFHGFGSSSKSDKVDRLKKLFPNKKVFAFDIDHDPDIAYPYLRDAIESALIENITFDKGVYFIGTSLGAWWAVLLSELFRIHTLAINPPLHTKKTLKELGLGKELCTKYNKLRIRNPFVRYVFSGKDVVIEHSETIKQLKNHYTIEPDAEHRFNGSEFERCVTEYINYYEGIS